MDKLGASTRSQAVALALEDGQIGEAGAHPAPTSRPNAAPPSPPPATPTATLTALLSGVAALADVDATTIYFAQEGGLALTLGAHASSAPTPTSTPKHELTLGEGSIGRVALERRARLVSAPQSDEHPSGAPMLVTPMVSGGRLSGILCLEVRSSRPTSRRELLLLEAFGNRVADILAGGRPYARPALGASALPRLLDRHARGLGPGALRLRRGLALGERLVTTRDQIADARDVAELEDSADSGAVRDDDSERLAPGREPASKLEQELDAGAVDVGGLAEVDDQRAGRGGHVLGDGPLDLGRIRAVDLAGDRRDHRLGADLVEPHFRQSISHHAQPLFAVKQPLPWLDRRRIRTVVPAIPGRSRANRSAAR